MSMTLTPEQQAALHRLQVVQIREARRVQRTVAHYYGFTPAQLRARERSAPLAEARQAAMYLMRTDLHWPMPTRNIPFPVERIGTLLERDHSTVLHGVAVIVAKLAADPLLRRTLDDIRAVLDREYEDDPAYRPAA